MALNGNSDWCCILTEVAIMIEMSSVSAGTDLPLSRTCDPLDEQR
jgi:hypothetical protein